LWHIIGQVGQDDEEKVIKVRGVILILMGQWPQCNIRSASGTVLGNCYDIRIA
jgi:hypothetical protein